MLLVTIQMRRRGSAVSAVGGPRNLEGRRYVCVITSLMRNHDSGRILGISHKVERLYKRYDTQDQARSSKEGGYPSKGTSWLQTFQSFRKVSDPPLECQCEPLLRESSFIC